MLIEYLRYVLKILSGYSLSDDVVKIIYKQTYITDIHDFIVNTFITRISFRRKY